MTKEEVFGALADKLREAVDALPAYSEADLYEAQEFLVDQIMANLPTDVYPFIDKVPEETVEESAVPDEEAPVAEEAVVEEEPVAEEAVAVDPLADGEVVEEVDGETTIVDPETTLAEPEAEEPVVEVIDDEAAFDPAITEEVGGIPMDEVAQLRPFLIDGLLEAALSGQTPMTRDETFTYLHDRIRSTLESQPIYGHEYSEETLATIQGKFVNEILGNLPYGVEPFVDMDMRQPAEVDTEAIAVDPVEIEPVEVEPVDLDPSEPAFISAADAEEIKIDAEPLPFSVPGQPEKAPMTFGGIFAIGVFGLILFYVFKKCRELASAPVARKSRFDHLTELL